MLEQVFSSLVNVLTRRAHAIWARPSVLAPCSQCLEKTWIRSQRGLRPGIECLGTHRTGSGVTGRPASYEGLEIGTSFSKRRSLNIFWTQRCFWHLSALSGALYRGRSGSRQTLPGTCFPSGQCLAAQWSQLVLTSDCQQCLPGTSSLHHSSSVDKLWRPRHSKEA